MVSTRETSDVPARISPPITGILSEMPVSSLKVRPKPTNIRTRPPIRMIQVSVVLLEMASLNISAAVAVPF